MACGNSDVSREALSAPPAPPAHPAPPANPTAARESRFEQISQVVITATQVVDLVVDLLVQQVMPHPVTQQEMEEWFGTVQEQQIEERLEQIEQATVVALEEQATPVSYDSS